MRDAWFRVYAPKDLWTLIRIKTRPRVGTYQVTEAYPELKANAKSLSTTYEERHFPRRAEATPPRLIEKFDSWHHILAVVRARAQWTFRKRDFGRWETDHTTR